MQLSYSFLARSLALLLLPLGAALAQTPAGVGIGTTAPDASAALDIVSSSRGALLPRVADATALATPATGLIVFQTGAPAGFYYNAGTPAAPSWQQLATAAGAAVTASNGLTKTGQNLTLGGPLTQPTTITQAGNSLTVAGVVGTPQQISQLTGTERASNGVTVELGQSFQLPAGATVTQVDLYADGGAGMLTFYQGNPDGTVLGSQAVTYAPGYAVTSIVLTTPIVVGAAGTYSFNTGYNYNFASNSNNPYAGGSLFLGNISYSSDLKFVVYYTTTTTMPALHVGGTGLVGVGTLTPTAQLDVTGSTRLRGLGPAGVVSTDANGNLSSSTGSGSFILNQTSTNQAGSFRINGAGTVGGLLTANGGATLAGTTSINTSGTAGTTIGGTSTGIISIGGTSTGIISIGGTGGVVIGNGSGGVNIGPGSGNVSIGGSTNTTFVGLGAGSTTSIGSGSSSTTSIGNGSASGPVTIGRSGGTVRVASLSPAGVVTNAADGTLGTATAASLDATTASNGLTETGQNVALGGALTQNTALILNGNNLSITAGLFIDQDNLGAVTVSAFTSYMALYQTIQAGLTGDLVQVVLSLKGNGTPPVPTLTVYSGSGTTGAVLGTATLSAPPPLGTVNSTFFFATPPALVAGQTYTLALTNTITSTANSVNWSVSSGNPYAGGSASTGGGTDFLFRTLVAPNTAAFTVTGVATGLNTSSPTATLDVNGSTRLRGLSTAGVVSTDADGNLSSTDGSGSFILNQTSTDQAGGFRVAGAGTVGGSLVVDAAGANNGSLTNGLRLGEAGTGEGLASRRTAGTNRYGLDFYTANTSRLSITQGGNVGLGLSDPAVGLHVAGQLRANVGLQFADRAASANLFEWFASNGTARLYSSVSARDVCAITTAGNMGINTSASTAYTLDVGGTIRATGTITGTSFTQTSDARFKTNVRPLSGALASVLALRGVRYHWNALGVQHGGTAGAGQVGLLAQELEQLYPELVLTDAQGYKSVNYAQLTPVLIEALKEQQQQIEALQAAAATTRAQTTATLESLAQRLRVLEAGAGQAQR